MKFLEKDLICIDLEGVNNLNEFSILISQIRKSGIIIDSSLWDMKTDLDMSKIFIHKLTLEILFIEVNIKGGKHIGLYPFLSDKLQEMKSFNIKKKMDMNSILERISEMGIESLTKKEKKILNNFGK